MKVGESARAAGTEPPAFRLKIFTGRGAASEIVMEMHRERRVALLNRGGRRLSITIVVPATNRQVVVDARLVVISESQTLELSTAEPHGATWAVWMQLINV